MTMRIPNFRGRRALVLHRADRNQAAVVEQLERLGLDVDARWPAEGVRASEADVLFFDSDLGFDGLFAWAAGAPPLPLIALLGSEAPGRIEWTLEQEPAAYLLKPVGSTGVFSALSIAFHSFAQKQAKEAQLMRLRARLGGRNVVLLAAATLMKRCDLAADAALRLLRAESMRRRVSLEAMSALVLDGKWLPPALSGPQRRPKLVQRLSGGGSGG